MTPQAVNLDAPIRYVRSTRAKRLRITIRPAPEVRVTLPHRVPLAEAQQFVAAKQAWINKHLRRFAQQQQRQTPPPALSKEGLRRAQHELFDRLEAFSKQHRLPYNRATFRCQKTRWGSCSSRNNISLNINMVFLPRRLQDYLLLHELAHIRHKNHSRAFWVELNRLCGCDAKALARELKKHTLFVIR